MLCRYAQHKNYDTAQGGMAIQEFSDFTQISGYAVEAMTRTVSAGLPSGTGAELLAQAHPITRVETAHVFLALFQLAG